MVFNMTWEEILKNTTRNGIKDDFEYLWFADAEHKWHSRNHYLFVKWWEKTCPIVLNVIRSYFDSMPFFCVWVLAIFIWFFIELTVNAAEFFNLKHSNIFFKKNFLYYGLATLKLREVVAKNELLKSIYRLRL